MMKKAVIIFATLLTLWTLSTPWIRSAWSFSATHGWTTTQPDCPSCDVSSHNFNDHTFTFGVDDNFISAVLLSRLTSTGTTSQFWRGDNTWSQMLFSSLTDSLLYSQESSTIISQIGLRISQPALNGSANTSWGLVSGYFKWTNDFWSGLYIITMPSNGTAIAKYGTCTGCPSTWTTNGINLGTKRYLCYRLRGGYTSDPTNFFITDTIDSTVIPQDSIVIASSGTTVSSTCKIGTGHYIKNHTSFDINSSTYALLGGDGTVDFISNNLTANADFLVSGSAYFAAGSYYIDLTGSGYLANLTTDATITAPSVAVTSGGSAGHVSCWKTSTNPHGYCSNAPNSSGTCTCN